MFLFVFALAIGLYFHASLVASPEQILPLHHILLLLIIPKVCIVLVYYLGSRVALSRLAKPNAIKRLRHLHMLETACRVTLLASYSADLRYGLLETVRSFVGDLVLVDELLVMLPPLLTMVALWSAYYPIDRRIREAALISTLDRSAPPPPVWSRWQFLLSQIRHQIAFIFVPLCAILALDETIHFVSRRFAQGDEPLTYHGFDVASSLQLIGVAIIFVFAPVIIRHVWDTEPLPAGSLRDRLADMCKLHRVGYRKLLLWRTFGGMSNAAVMGIFKPLRYILLTDALLEHMNESHVEAVMAHEIAHVRKHHIFWLLGAAFASVSLLQIVAYYAAPLVEAAFAIAGYTPAVDADPADIRSAEFVLAILMLLGWYLAFGWVSRRFERQADTFAVQHLSRRLERQAGEAVTPEQVGRVHPVAAGLMVDALGRIATLNHIPPAGRSWRHGSIVWRQDYLKTLPGQPLDELPIDLTVSLIKLATAVAILAVVAFYIFNPGAM